MLFRWSTAVCLPLVASAFVSPRSAFRPTTHHASSSSDNPPSIDVSDLGLTMEDLNKPLPPEMLQVMTTTGYESTNRLESVQDDGCEWTESLEDVQARLQIPGLRGQPAAAISVLFSKTTISVSVFGRVVWSAILRGSIVPDACQFVAEDGSDMIPILRIAARKGVQNERWGGFILQIGEDSLL